MSNEATLHFVKFGGSEGMVTGEMFNMGRGVRRKREISWLFHFCFGYVSGFPMPSILYYLITRHTTNQMMHWAWKRERQGFEDASGQLWPRCSKECRQCNPKGV